MRFDEEGNFVKRGDNRSKHEKINQRERKKWAILQIRIKQREFVFLFVL